MSSAFMMFTFTVYLNACNDVPMMSVYTMFGMV